MWEEHRKAEVLASRKAGGSWECACALGKSLVRARLGQYRRKQREQVLL